MKWKYKGYYKINGIVVLSKKWLLGYERECVCFSEYNVNIIGYGRFFGGSGGVEFG